MVKQNVDGKRLDDSDSTASRQRIDSIDEKGYSFRSAISTVNYWILAGAIALRISAQAGVMIQLVPILVWKNFEEELGGITVAIISASAIFTRVLMGWLGDKVEKKDHCFFVYVSRNVCHLNIFVCPSNNMDCDNFFVIDFDY